MEGRKLPACDLSISPLLTKRNFGCAFRLAIPRCCNRGEQSTSPLPVAVLFASALAVRGLSAKRCGADSEYSVIKGGRQERATWIVFHINLKILRSLKHKFTRENWEASRCIPCPYYCKPSTYTIPSATFSPGVKRCIAQGPQPPQKSRRKPSSVIYYFFVIQKKQRIVCSGLFFVNHWYHYHVGNPPKIKK